MAHELAGALQQTSRIRQRCSLKESNVYVGREYVDVTKGRISQTCSRTAVMQKLPDFVSTVSHHLKPFLRDGSQLTCMFFIQPSMAGSRSTVPFNRNNFVLVVMAFRTTSGSKEPQFPEFHGIAEPSVRTQSLGRIINSGLAGEKSPITLIDVDFGEQAAQACENA
jgi:hypothetical protein